MNKLMGGRWSKIASHLPGRTDNEIKNAWNTHLKKRSLLTINNNIDSSSLAFNVSNELTNQEETLDHPKVTELTEAAGPVLVEDVDHQPSTSSSTISSNSGQGKASCSWDTPLYHDEEMIKNNLEMSLEHEVEFWNMLEPQLITDHEMLEVENWVRLLEKELGLVGPSQKNDQDDETKTMGEEQAVSEMWCKISDQISPLWPTSPANFGL
ncbi:hypothetical protein L1987_26435 [Smallanthus sonchifolius]|uniref:Uncharacterized protein n=1 Tax=Smallanthus sonchifolius TaxID=185202 RepID=A0ACB9I9E7_9ASTR|nr:hypothetical protein L1987_26435 [Smallanthus sonchifolius]